MMLCLNATGDGRARVASSRLGKAPLRRAIDGFRQPGVNLSAAMVVGRLNLRPWSMTEVTAEMIERGRGTDPTVAAERRRRAREKLTSSSGTHRAFDLELLRLYAERRKASLPWLALLGVAFVLILSTWRTTPAPLVWVAFDALSVLCGCALARRFLRRPDVTINVVRWERIFVIAESVQGGLWSMVVVFACDGGSPPSRSSRCC